MSKLTYPMYIRNIAAACREINSENDLYKAVEKTDDMKRYLAAFGEEIMNSAIALGKGPNIGFSQTPGSRAVMLDLLWDALQATYCVCDMIVKTRKGGATVMCSHLDEFDEKMESMRIEYEDTIENLEKKKIRDH